jgi:uncharacterized membrane protein
MDMMDGETEVRDYGLERLMMLSDGVFAIAMTLLALDLRPEGPWDHTLAGLRIAIAGPFQAFFWSFFAASIFWAGHRRQFGAYRRSDGIITFFNLLLLGEIILLPAATRILTEMKYSPDGLTLYLGLFALIGCTNAANWLYVAFLTDILRPPQRGVAEKCLVALMQMVLPVGMTALGVFSSANGLHWLLFVMPLPMLVMHWARVGAVAIDRRISKAGWGVPPPPDPPSLIKASRQ